MKFGLIPSASSPTATSKSNSRPTRPSIRDTRRRSSGRFSAASSSSSSSSDSSDEISFHAAELSDIDASDCDSFSPRFSSQKLHHSQRQSAKQQSAKQQSIKQQSAHASQPQQHHSQPAYPPQQHPPTEAWTTASLRFHSRRAPPPRRKDRPDPSIDHLSALISALNLQRQREQALELQTWTERNAKLWMEVEGALRGAEEEQIKLNAVRQREAEEKARMDREAVAAREEREKVTRQEAEREREAERKIEREAEQRRKLEEERQEENKPKEEWLRWVKVMQDLKKDVLPLALSQHSAWCSQSKRKLNPKFGQLTPDLANAKLITGSVHDVLKSAPSPQAYTFILNHISKLLIKQAEAEVTAKLSTAYPLSKVALALIVMGHAELGNVLMARLVKKCCWVLPYYPTKGTYTEEEYRKVLGQTDPSETGAKYSDRMSGIFAFHAAMLQTLPHVSDLPIPDGESVPASEVDKRIPEQFRLSGAWKWIASMLRLPMTTFAPSALLMTTFMDIAGASFLRGYGKQAGKVLKLVLEQGCRHETAQWDKDTKATVGRLTIILEEWERSGQLKQELEQGWS